MGVCLNNHIEYLEAFILFFKYYLFAPLHFLITTFNRPQTTMGVYEPYLPIYTTLVYLYVNLTIKKKKSKDNNCCFKKIKNLVGTLIQI